MNTKTVYLFDPISFQYIGPYAAQESPEEPGKFIEPVSSTGIVVPEFDPTASICTFHPATQTWVIAAIPAAPVEPDPPVVPPTPAEVIALAVRSAFAAGLTVRSTATPAINGTYPLDEATQNKIMALVLFTQMNNDFPGGASVYPMPDISGAMHIFPSIAVFDVWSTAIANHVAAIDLYGASLPGAVLPAPNITIA
jgi:hypothetical protein